MCHGNASPFSRTCFSLVSWGERFAGRNKSYCKHLTIGQPICCNFIHTYLHKDVSYTSLLPKVAPACEFRRPATLHNMPEDYSSSPPPPPPTPYAQTPPYQSAPPYALPPPRRHSAWFYIGIIMASLAAVCLLMAFMVWATMRSVTGSDASGFGLSTSQIGVIDISGVILSPDTIDTQLRKFGDDPSVKLIFLHI